MGEFRKFEHLQLAPDIFADQHSTGHILRRYHDTILVRDEDGIAPEHRTTEPENDSTNREPQVLDVESF